MFERVCLGLFYLLGFSFLAFINNPLLGQAVAAAPLKPPAIIKGIPALPGLYLDGCHYILVDFYSASCGACVRMQPLVGHLEQELKAKVQVLHVDVNHPANQSMLERYPVQYTPTYLGFNTKGQPIFEMQNKLDPKRLWSDWHQLAAQKPAITGGC